MKLIPLVISMLMMTACYSVGGGSATPKDPGCDSEEVKLDGKCVVLKTTITEPSDPGLQACEGTVNDVAELECSVEDTNEVVASSLCGVDPSDLEREFQSPAGSVSTPVSNGQSVLTCVLGADTGTTSLNCDNGFIDISGSCVVGVTNMMMGARTTCAEYSDGDIKCVGRSIWGGGSITQVVNPITVAQLVDSKHISMGEYDICSIKSDDTVECSGQNAEGMLGSGDTIAQPTAFTVSEWDNALKVAVGFQTTCVLAIDGSVKCSGANYSAQYGNGIDTTVSQVPYASTGYSNAKNILPMQDGMCVQRMDDSWECAADNYYGSLGNGAPQVPVKTPIPMPIFDDTKQIAISQGGTHICVIKNDNKVFCSGANFDGQIGTGNTTSLDTFTEMPQWSGAKYMSLGQSHTCAIMSDDTVMCSGKNFNGQLADGTNVRKLSPVTASGFSDAKMIFTGYEHTCVVKNDNSVVCAGLNTEGMLGVGSDAVPSYNTATLTLF